MDDSSNSPKQYFDYENGSRSEAPAYYNSLQFDDGKWTREQTQILIDMWKKQKSILLNAASSSAEHFKVWKMIAGEVNKYQPPKTLQQCKKKFRNIRYICKTAMTNNSESGAKKHFPLFYTDFVEIIGESERVKGNRKSYTPPLDIGAENISDTSSEYHNNDIDEKSHSADGNSNTKRHTGGISTNITEMDKNNTNTSPSFVEINTRNTSPCRPNNQNYLDKDKNEHHNDKILVDFNCADGVNRKHKMADVSIMGRSYSTSKKYKRIQENFESETSTPDIKREHSSLAHFTEEPFLNRTFLTAGFSSVKKRETSNHESPLLARSPGSTSALRENTKELYANGFLNNFGNPGTSTSPQSQTPGLFSINERFLEMQERQVQVFSDMLERHEQFLLRLLQQQREAATEAQSRDREFMLSLVEMFVKRT